MPDLSIAPEVAEALERGQPVVALESTLITHGLPYPKNRDTALAMEDAIRDEGVVPATIAILDGQIMVGLTAENIEMLAQMDGEAVRKCSRRDIPIAVGLRQTGATTVAGTMIIAHMAGIHVFSTGGIGGVHRGHPQDVSADLIELGRTPVTVVCSGAKSLLDIPLTLEVLETQGVPILGYETDTLPLFYTRQSRYGVDVRVDTPEDVAKVMQARDALQARHGILVTVPVPEADAMLEHIAEEAIAQATREADAQGIHGKDVTPFILGRVVALTEGRSMQANYALLVHNSRIGARIAKAFAML